jgi:hypothetical protein
MNTRRQGISNVGNALSPKNTFFTPEDTETNYFLILTEVEK